MVLTTGRPAQAAAAAAHRMHSSWQPPAAAAACSSSRVRLLPVLMLPKGRAQCLLVSIPGDL